MKIKKSDRFLLIMVIFTISFAALSFFHDSKSILLRLFIIILFFINGWTMLIVITSNIKSLWVKLWACANLLFSANIAGLLLIKDNLNLQRFVPAEKEILFGITNHDLNWILLEFSYLGIIFAIFTLRKKRKEGAS